MLVNKLRLVRLLDLYGWEGGMNFFLDKTDTNPKLLSISQLRSRVTVDIKETRDIQTHYFNKRSGLSIEEEIQIDVCILNMRFLPG